MYCYIYSTTVSSWFFYMPTKRGAQTPPFVVDNEFTAALSENKYIDEEAGLFISQLSDVLEEIFSIRHTSEIVATKILNLTV